MNPTLFRELSDAIDMLDGDDAVRVIVVRGEGRGFSSGLDLTEAMSEFAPMLQSSTAGPRSFISTARKSHVRTTLVHSRRFMRIRVSGFRQSTTSRRQMVQWVLSTTL